MVVVLRAIELTGDVDDRARRGLLGRGSRHEAGRQAQGDNERSPESHGSLQPGWFRSLTVGSHAVIYRPKPGQATECS